jgi:hypothetical protein
LRRFGLAGSDADASFRNLARDMSTLGAGARIGVVLRAIWGYGSQARLIIWAIVAFALAIGLGFLHGPAALAAIERLGDAFKPIADWIAAHGEWFDRASQVLYVLGALAIALNLWRALGFSNLLLRGARLLNLESRERRRDLDQRATRLNQRVAALTAEADGAAKRAEAASQRAGGKAAVRAPCAGGRGAGVSRRPWRQDRTPEPGGAGPGPAHSRDRQSRRTVAGRRDRLDRRCPERDRARLRRLIGFRSRPPGGHARRPTQSTPAVGKMAAGHGQLAGSGRG